MSSKRTAAIAGALAAALMGAAGAANAFQASTTVDIVQLASITTDVFLPQYSGPGTISSVALSISGLAWGGVFYPYFLDPGQDGFTVPSSPVSWDIGLYTFDGSNLDQVADAIVNTEILGGSVPPCSGDLSCDGELDVFTPFAPVSAHGKASDLSDFAGTGTVDILIIDDGSFDLDGLTATITETITTSVPEPSTWALMLAGFGLLGGALRGKVHHRAA